MTFKMKFELKINSQPLKFLKKTEPILKERIKSKLKLLEEEPFHYLEHFEGESFYKLRIGEYRALFDIDFEHKILYLRLLNHRKKVYKK